MKEKKNTIKYITNYLINWILTLDKIMNVNILRSKISEETDIVYNYFLNQMSKG